MPVRRTTICDLGAAVYGAIVRDRATGDWLIVISSRVGDRSRLQIFNSLMAQLDEWDRRGHPTHEARRLVRRWTG